MGGSGTTQVITTLTVRWGTRWLGVQEEAVLAKNVVLMRPERAHERLVILLHGRVAAVWDPASFNPHR